LLLVVGSRLEFSDRGDHELKGVPGTWRLFAVQTAQALRRSAAATSTNRYQNSVDGADLLDA
jgi:hypothetical protein